MERERICHRGSWLVRIFQRGYDDTVKMTETELAERLAEADRIRAILRRCTIEWRALGDRILSERQRGPGRSDDRRAHRR